MLDKRKLNMSSSLNKDIIIIIIIIIIWNRLRYLIVALPGPSIQLL